MTRMLLVLSIVLVLLGGCGDAEHDAKAMEIEVGDQVTLADGTDVRVSSRRRQEIWVQFREDGDGWTEPEKVHEGNRGPTGARGRTRGDQPAGERAHDDFAPDTQIICHDGLCRRRAPLDHAVQEDGTVAARGPGAASLG